jgi:hypothetical protein
MLPLNMVIPATRRLAARVFLGATELARRSTPEWTSCKSGVNSFLWHRCRRWKERYLVMSSCVPVRDSGGVCNSFLKAMSSEGT